MTVKSSPLYALLVMAALMLAIGSRAFSADTPEAEKPAADQRPPHVVVESSNPLSGKPEAIEAGKKLYYMWCTQCHGLHADGVSRFGSYAADLRHFWRGYKEFVQIVKNGRPEKQMPPWKEVLDEQQIAQVGAFLETLSIEGAQWK
jgi:mono/diheme cytochrome c family protein